VRPLRFIVTGGGTGGHVYPAIAIAEQIESMQDSSVEFIGSTTGPEGGAAEKAGLKFLGFPLSGLAGKRPLKMLGGLRLFISASLKCRRMFAESPPVCVIGTGGYAAAPACFAAAWLKVPLVLHEMNQRPGLVTRMLSRRAEVVTVAFEATVGFLPRAAKSEVTGVPVRRQIVELAEEGVRATTREAALAAFGLEANRRTLLVFGGSQGALAINDATWEAVRGIEQRSDLQILHLTGTGGFDLDRRRATENSLKGKKLLYRSEAYCESMQDAYSVADLALTRAGAGTVAELSAARIPAILVPFPYASGGHQADNAGELERRGAAKVVFQQGESAQSALSEAVRLLDDQDQLKGMRAALSAMPEAPGVKGIVGIVEELTLRCKNTGA